MLVKCLLFPALYLGLCALGLASTYTSAPNILFILVDDQRNDTLGCAGHPIIETPNIDRLAESGVRFENAYVTTSICMSSRATIFTGLTETGHGYTGGGFPAIPVQEMDVDTSFPVLLREANYRNGYYGKQHVKFAEGRQAALQRMFHDYKVYNVGGPGFIDMPDASKRHTADLIGDHSVEFLRAQPHDRPFCLFLSFNIAHARDGDLRPGMGHFPWPPAADGMYDDVEPLPPRLGDPKYFEMQPEFLRKSLNRERWFWRWDTPEKYRTNMRAYYRMLSGMDAVVGRVLEELEAQGLSENTIVIYTADNGFYMGERGFAGKWTHYEESLRVPLIIYDPRPGTMRRCAVVEPLALNLDLPATMLEMADVAVPEKYQGTSLIPVLTGSTPVDWREDFFVEHHSTHPTNPEWRGVHGKRYAYADYYRQNPRVELLYDLQTDPDQLNNLAAEPAHQKLLQCMRTRTEEYLKAYTRPVISELKNPKR
jgi:arylsulfatase A-like enzyme